MVLCETPQKSLPVCDLSFAKDYKLVLDFQKELVEKRIKKQIPDSLILVEHDHVITLGRSSRIDNVLVRDLPIFEIERGGDVTYHGPGQLVAYPIFSLEENGLGVRQFVELLEAVIITSLAKMGLKNAAGRFGKETGVWVEGRKIASIGVAVSHWVSYHGFALNVNTDLTYFRRINPCGYEWSVMTSVSKELGLVVDFGKAKEIVIQSFSEVLSTRPLLEKMRI